MKFKSILAISLSVSIFLTTVLNSDEKSEPQTEPQQKGIPKRVTGKDGTPMVLIPAGEFQMGSNTGREDQKPVHIVYVDAFYMDTYEVTNAQYQKFVEATGHWKPDEFYDKPRFNHPNQPVIGISWKSAKAYCEWQENDFPPKRSGKKQHGVVWKESDIRGEIQLTRNERITGITSAKQLPLVAIPLRIATASTI